MIVVAAAAAAEDVAAAAAAAVSVALQWKMTIVVTVSCSIWKVVAPPALCNAAFDYSAPYPPLPSSYYFLPFPSDNCRSVVTQFAK